MALDTKTLPLLKELDDKVFLLYAAAKRCEWKAYQNDDCGSSYSDGSSDISSFSGSYSDTIACSDSYTLEAEIHLPDVTDICPPPFGGIV